MEKAAQVAAAGKKRKLSLEESEWSTSSVQIKTQRLSSEAPENSASSAANYGNSKCETVSLDHRLAASCQLEKGNSKFVALEENEAAVGFFATAAGDSLDCTEGREMTPSGEAQAAEAGELDQSTARQSVSDSTIEKMPSEAELEEFFAAAEKNLQKKFMDKYNYDIVKDQPLEGRYEWVHVQINP